MLNLCAALSIWGGFAVGSMAVMAWMGKEGQNEFFKSQKTEKKSSRVVLKLALK